MRYSELNDKDRWAAIRAGVKAGYNSIDDIEKAYNEYAEGGHVYATKGNLTKDELNTERGIIIAQINENPELLFTPGYEQWREYYRRNGQLDNMWNKIPFEKQAAIFQNNPKSITALSNKAQADFGAARTREKTNEVAPKVIGGMAGTIAAPFAATSMVSPFLGGSLIGAGINASLLGGAAALDKATQTEEEKKANANLPFSQRFANGLGYLMWTPQDGIDIFDSVSQLGKIAVGKNPNSFNERVNDATNEINQARVKTHNEIAPVINANDKAAAERAAASTPSVATTTSTTTDTRVKVRTPQQTTTQPVQPTQQQAVTQKPNKMQGFMNKLGAASPYIGDFVGWTLGNSKFFNYGGNIYEIKG